MFKFLKVSTYYRDFLRYYYHNYPHIKTACYKEQFIHLMNQHFAWSDNYSRFLNKKGVETMEIVTNATPLQQAWAKENGTNPYQTEQNILIAQIKKFKPEVIYFQDSINYNGEFIKEIKKKHPFIKLIIGNVCAPFTAMQCHHFVPFNFFTVCSPFFKQQLAKYSIKSIIIPHAFDERVLKKNENDKSYPEADIIFQGSIIADEGFHNLRKEILEKVIIEDLPFTFYGNLPDSSYISLIKKQASYLASKTLDKIGLSSITEQVNIIKKGRNHSKMPQKLKISSTLKKAAKPPLFGIDMFKAIAKAKIGFNIHIDCAGEYAANMRLFETTGAGSCLITDNKKNINELFEDGKEIVTYNNATECIEKMKWLLNNPEKRKKIATAGQKRTLKDHTFESRADILYNEIVKYINQ
ncbi:glycosyltransferase [Marinilabiliaceae bacterium ANBcel2]|nr:glycosyltransferase [Marinilabiliaceae bacterium ANBcel2]